MDKSNKGSRVDTDDKRKLPALAEMLSNRRTYNYQILKYFASKLACCYRLRAQPWVMRAIKRRRLHNDSI